MELNKRLEASKVVVAAKFDFKKCIKAFCTLAKIDSMQIGLGDIDPGDDFVEFNMKLKPQDLGALSSKHWGGLENMRINFVLEATPKPGIWSVENIELYSAKNSIAYFAQDVAIEYNEKNGKMTILG